MNSKGHAITSIYMSGGQAKNILMMELFANTCDMPIVLPYSHSLAVVLGAAMLGRFADEASREKLEGDQIGERLWKIMVSDLWFVLNTFA
jgi:ribulose kinase